MIYRTALTFAFFALTFLTLAGCSRSNNKQDEASATTAAPSKATKQIVAETSTVPEGFNRDIHVLRTIAQEIDKLAAEEGENAEKKRSLLQKELHTRLNALGNLPTDLTEADREFVDGLRKQANAGTGNAVEAAAVETE